MSIWGFVRGDVKTIAECKTDDGGRTVIFLRSMKVPAKHWEAVVLYDAWGSPYVKCNGHGAAWGEKALFADGRTSDTWLYGTEWRHKSGPQVKFPEKPSKPFP